MWVEDGVLHGERLPRHLLPLFVKFFYVDGHQGVQKGPHLTAKHAIVSKKFVHKAFLGLL